MCTGWQTYAADIFFAQSWRDERLRFNQKMPNQTGYYRLLPLHWLKDIWHPDSYFKNAKQVTFQEMTIPNHYVWLYNDNSILYMVKLTLVLSCAMNFQYYPHDTQQCSMKIESLSHTTDDPGVSVGPEGALEVDPIELPQLDLVSNVTGDCTHIYATGSFTCVEVVFTFKRRLGYYLFHTYIPTCLIVIMSWISFWIRPEAVPARVTLGVTSLLTLSTQHANSQKSLPPVSYIKAIDVFMNACTVFVFLSLMEYAMVNVIMGDLVDADESLMRRSIRSVRRRLTVRRRRPARRHQQGSSRGEPAESGHSSRSSLLPWVGRLTTPSQSHLLPWVGRLTTPSQSHLLPWVGRLTTPSHLLPWVGRLTTPSQSHLLPWVGRLTTPSQSHLLPWVGRLTTPSQSHLLPWVGRLTTTTDAEGLPMSDGPRDAASLHNGAIFAAALPQPSAFLRDTSQEQRHRAILVDRFSRVFFPLSFVVLNTVYWVVFYFNGPQM
ncbi:LOW QUALITY PROTEIN: glycine receptor subunit alphaZ1-like [Pollicipes pollicipes]|uniref:LOW QUALITY PROTEIN: glycine receptor subunit alphaZ1-like n=1 Tax=Pollicipes pollicipes TaxID=41117 RepID=UPI001884E816|nr:LOW QUALITY PROTEIN: glycine receptor subunit alphaZ1-like [Pollicipes pollicipes]